MIDRAYLPFQSARDYQDVNMQKWMGFFLSEHTSALSEDEHKITYCSDLSLHQKLLLLSQSYANQLTIQVTTAHKNTVRKFIGTISSITQSDIILKTSERYFNIPLNDILSIKLMEEIHYESA